MSAHVSKGSTKPERLAGGCCQPSSRMSSRIQIWNACVGTVFTCSHHLAPARLALDRARRATCGRRRRRRRARRSRSPSVTRSVLLPAIGAPPRSPRSRAPRAPAAPVHELLVVGRATASSARRARRRAAGIRRRPSRAPARRTPASHVRRLVRPAGAPSSTFVRRWKNSKRTPRCLQHLVERGEDDVAHAGAHAPEERAAVGEEHPHRAAQRHAGGETRPAHVAVLVGEHEIVDARA